MNRNVVWNGIRERLLARILSSMTFAPSAVGSALNVNAAGGVITSITTVTTVSSITSYGFLSQSGLTQMQTTESFQVGYRRNLVFS